MPVEPRPLPMPEAEAYWQDKVPMAPGEFRTLGQRARSRAFAVSGMDRMDLVSRVHAAVARAIAEGRTLEEFRREAGPLLEQEGITSRARLETIFRTNVQGAYLAGRYAQMLEAVRFRPYWRYSAVNDSRTRPSHRALHGLVRRYDDPFWDVFYPPNGFNCRCTVSSLSERQVRAAGIEVGQGIPDLIEPLDRETGLPGLPVRPWPDPGFANNAAKDWLAGLAPTEAEGGFRPLLLSPLCPDGRGHHAADPCWESLADVAPRHVRPFTAKDILPAGLTQVAYLKAFLEEFGLGQGESRLLTLPGVNLPLVVSDRLFLNVKDNTWKVVKGGRERYLKLLARTILDPYEIWQGSEARGDGRVVPVLNLIRLFTDGEQKVGGFAVFKLYGRTWSGATVFPPNPGNKAAMLHYLEKQRLELAGRGGVRLFREP